VVTPSAMSTESCIVFPTVFGLKYPSENSLLEVLVVALARCESAGLTLLLSEMLPNVNTSHLFDPHLGTGTLPR